ncbi:MAG: M13 family metallopeptidase [Proteobacteria bacterium]|nr:M13 family metallopeptidase [Pseudomonadota bacterium]
MTFAGALSLGASAAPPVGVIEAAGMDPSVRPGDDFYSFANGGWVKATAVPAQGAYGTSAMLAARNAQRVRDLIQQAADTGHVRDAVEQKVGDYYASLTDQAGIDAKGIAPLQDDLAAIAAIADRTSLSAYLGGRLRADVDATVQRTDGLFGMWVHQGFTDADRYYPHLLQGGLGLQDREDYLDVSPKAAALRADYQAHVAKVLKQAGVEDAQGKAERILAFETRIAKTHASLADTQDPAKTNNLWKRADFDAKAPGMDWKAYFGAARLDRQPLFMVWQPSAVSGISALVGAEPLDMWKDYLRFRLIEHYAQALPKAYADPRFDNTQDGLGATSAALGEAVGKLYVRRYFPPQAKARARAMVDNLVEAYRPRIEAAGWMAPETKQKALKKLQTLSIGLGYPDRWIDYSGLQVVRGDAVGNLRRAELFKYRRSLERLATPVDPAEWTIDPQLVGAVIIFSPNTIQFAAGILQPPYFDPDGDDASNYGSAGAGIAHEIAHTFDELGNQYDEQGRLVAWWAPGDEARYQAAAAPLLAQANAYCPLADACLNGKQVLGENINDLVGLDVAHDAYIRSLHGRPDIVKGGLTGEQRFFLAFGQRWRRQQGEAALRRQVQTDIHAPGVFRSDTVRNLDAWYDAFAVRPGDKLYLEPRARVRVW